jgi:hypothetical protein
LNINYVKSHCSNSSNILDFLKQGCSTWGTQVGYRGTQNLKSPQNKPIPVFYFDQTEHQWGYGGGQVLKSCLGAHKGIK